MESGRSLLIREGYYGGVILSGLLADKRGLQGAMMVIRLIRKL